MHAPQYCGGTLTDGSYTDAELFDCARLDGVSTEGSDTTMDSLGLSKQLHPQPSNIMERSHYLCSGWYCLLGAG